MTGTVRHATTRLEQFLAKGPYLFMQIEGYKLWEHPTRGDTDCVYMSTPSGRLIATGFYDLDDFDLDLCIELDSNSA
jgi:hypothetical protein